MSDIKVHLRANNGQFVCAEGGGLGPVVANRDRPLEWETFVLGDINEGPLNSGDNVTIRSVNGFYMCAENGGGGEVIAKSLSVN